jgi:hypothetical protein
MLLTPYQISRISEKPFSRYLTVAILCSDPVYFFSNRNTYFFLVILIDFHSEKSEYTKFL